ncbi:unnamed protein product, partial [Trichobilharzia regenti]
MFLKPFIVRSNTQIKASEKFEKQLLNSFYDVHRLKVITSSEVKVNIYKFGSVPLIIEHEKDLLPTGILFILIMYCIFFGIYLIFFHISKYLMLPGVVTDGPLLPDTFNKIEKDVLCCISTTSNRAPIAVGRTAMSNYDMYMSAGRGRAVSVLHVMATKPFCVLITLFTDHLFWPDNECSVLPTWSGLYSLN